MLFTKHTNHITYTTIHTTHDHTSIIKVHNGCMIYPCPSSPRYSYTYALIPSCEAPFPGGPLTTRQPAEYSCMSGDPIPLMKIGQSLLCTGSSTQNTTCPNINIMRHVHTSILIKNTPTIYHSSRVITILFTKTYIKI